MTNPSVCLLGPLDPRTIVTALGHSDARAGMLPRSPHPALTDLALALARRGVRLDLITLHKDASVPLRVPLECGSLAVVPGRRRGAARDLWAVERSGLEAALRESGAEVVNAHWSYEYAAAAVAGPRPHVISFHDAPWAVLRHHLMERPLSFGQARRASHWVARAYLAARVARRTRLSTAPSPYLVAEWQRRGRIDGPIELIPNFVAPALPESRDPNLVVVVSSTAPWKNARGAVEGFRSALETLPDIHCDVVGPGLHEGSPFVRRLETGVSGGRLHFRGEMDRDAVRSLLARAAIVVVPSFEESFSLVALEAMAAGTPVVAGEAAGGLPWVVDGAGVLVDVRDPRAIGAGIIAVMSDHARAASLAAIGRRRSETEFSEGRVVGEYLRVYDRARSRRTVASTGSTAVGPERRARVAGVLVDAVDLAGAADAVVANARAGGRGALVCLANAWTCVCADREPAVAEAVGRASLVVPDGVPLVRALRRAGHASAGKVTGIELVPEVARRGLASDLAHYVYGGAPGVAERAAAGILESVPGVRVVGSSAPPIAGVDALLGEPLERLRGDLERTRPDVLWIGLGSPKQEVWMAAAAARLPVPVMVGVGAALGYLAGDRRPAPRLLRHAGGEWLWRLAAEPRRLWRRYILGNLRFLRLLMRSGSR